MIAGMLGRLLRLAGSALALFLCTLVIPNVNLTADTAWGKVLTVVLVAIIFGLINFVLKPIAKTLGCALYALTLGLIALVVNALLFLLTGWIAGQLDIPFEVKGFWPAGLLGALFVGIVSALLGLLTDKLTEGK
jgi:putative membrane protein